VVFKISGQAEAARDSARESSGRFGHQQHQPSTLTLGGAPDGFGGLDHGEGRMETLDVGAYLTEQLPENRHTLKMWSAAQEISDATGVNLWDSLDYAEGFMQDFDPGTAEHEEFLDDMAKDTWNVSPETARTIDSRLREVYDADIDADDVHAHGNALAPQAQYV
jgi:hypothetical protein